MIAYSIVVLLLLFFLVFLPFRLINDRPVFYALLFPIYSMAWQTVSVLVVEYGFYITEQKMISFQTGGALRTVFSHAIFVFIFCCLSVRKSQSIIVRDNNCLMGNRVAFFIIGWVIMGLLLGYVNAALSPSPLINGGVTRFNYMEGSAMPWLKYLTSERFFYAFILIGSAYSFFCAFSNILKGFCFFLYLALLVYLFLVGEKFTGPVLGSLVFFIFVFSAHSFVGWRRKDVRFLKLYFVFFVSLTFLYVLYAYAFKYELGQALGSPLLGLLYRGFVLQGHTQWGLDYLFSNGNLGGGGPWIEYKGSGMSVAMHAIAPPEVLQAFSLVNNASFSSAYPGVVLYSFGWGGVFLAQSLFSVIFYVFSRIFSWSASKRYILSSILSMQCIFVCFYVYNMGNFNAFWSLKFLVASSGLLFLVFYRSCQSHGKLNNV